MTAKLVARRTGALKRQPRIGLALGGGGARGLAHIPMLEAFDELHLKPSVIVGTSIGAIFGAAYASGIPATHIRAHTEELLSRRLTLMREILSARVLGLQGLWKVLAAQSALLDPLALLEVILPSRCARDFAELSVPLRIVATDFYAQEPLVFSQGALRQAVAASMALPVIFQPVLYQGRALLDGGLVNPLPFDVISGEADIVVAVDVAGAPVPSEKRDHPSAAEALFASSFIFERSLVREKLKSRQPDIYVDGGTSHFQVLDFLKAREILAAAEPAKARLKSQLQRVLAAETVIEAEPIEPAAKPSRTSRAKAAVRRTLTARKKAK